MNRKTIVTNMAVVACDVCGRTLLRGENADVFLHGGARRCVCELCTARAIHEGWIREGLDDVGRRTDERTAARSLLGRLRARRAERDDADQTASAAGPPMPVYDPATYDPDHFAGTLDGAQPAGAPEAAPEAAPALEVTPVAGPAPERERVAPAPVRGPAPPPDPATGEHPRRSFNAVPTNAERKVVRALEVFNLGVHTRTVAGVARSLGSPTATARPSETEGSVVTIVIAWELSWYRYEVDLGDEASGVRLSEQGTELSELPDADRTGNVAADASGFLTARAASA